MFEKLEEKIAYSFQDKNLLRLAMTHSSYANEKTVGKHENNERLEFLGDAVLELLSSQFLFKKYPKEPEGVLTKKRASMVCEPTLALCAKDINLGDFLLLGKGEDRTGGRMRPSVTSDAFEALIGAIYLDGGFESAKQFVERFVLNDIDKKQLFYDSKTNFQQLIQKDFPEKQITYRIIEESGPAHKKHFVVQVLVGEDVCGEGSGSSKKSAEQEAAYQALLRMKSMQ